MPDEPIIRLRDINKYYGTHHVLRDVSLDVMRSEVVVVVGPSGRLQDRAPAGPLPSKTS